MTQSPRRPSDTQPGLAAYQRQVLLARRAFVRELDHASVAVQRSGRRVLPVIGGLLALGAAVGIALIVRLVRRPAPALIRLGPPPARSSLLRAAALALVRAALQGMVRMAALRATPWLAQAQGSGDYPLLIEAPFAGAPSTRVPQPDTDGPPFSSRDLPTT